MIELAIIVPTFNERDNIVELTAHLENVLSSIDWEVVMLTMILLTERLM